MKKVTNKWKWEYRKMQRAVLENCGFQVVTFTAW